MVLPYLKSMLPYCCAALPAAVAWRVFAVRSLRLRLCTRVLHALLFSARVGRSPVASR